MLYTLYDPDMLLTSAAVAAICRKSRMCKKRKSDKNGDENTLDFDVSPEDVGNKEKMASVSSTPRGLSADGAGEISSRKLHSRSTAASRRNLGESKEEEEEEKQEQDFRPIRPEAAVPTPYDLVQRSMQTRPGDARALERAASAAKVSGPPPDDAELVVRLTARSPFVVIRR